MVEVLKTNVSSPDQARMLVRHIRTCFAEYRVNFDLDDCDRILRIATEQETVDAPGLIRLLEEHGYAAEVLPDTVMHPLCVP